MDEHQAQQVHAARKHSSMRESIVRAAIGEPGGLKHLLQRFTITPPEGEDTETFRTNYDEMDWSMPCDECRFILKTSLHNGRLLCTDCVLVASGL